MGNSLPKPDTMLTSDPTTIPNLELNAWPEITTEEQPVC